MALDIPKIAERKNIFRNSPQLNQVLKNQGGRNVPKDDDDTDTDTLPTKEFWSSAAGAAQGIINGCFVVVAGSWDSTAEAGISFKVPHDFTSITSAEVIVWEDAGNYGTANLDIGANYGAAGEDYNNHAETDRASTYSLTQNKFTAIDVSGILTSLAANDYVSIRISNEDGGTFDLAVVGLRLRYT